jgi:predicted MFS family arabinose efflux permease
MFILAFSNEIVTYLISSVCFGIAFGLLSPSIFAWAVDLSLPGQKGKAVGTLFVFMELGIIIGSSVGGLVYQNNTSNFITVFLICASLALSPLFIISFFQSKQRNQSSL